MSSKGFTLAEILVASVLVGMLVLAVTSVDITSRRFFGTAINRARVQDEAKIAMEHIVRNIQLGIGDMTEPLTPAGSPPVDGDSRGFLILNSSAELINPADPDDLGIYIRVNRDGLNNPAAADGRFDPNDTNDGIIEYAYNSAAHRIIYRCPTGTEILADKMVEDAIFTQGTQANQVNVEIVVIRNPGEGPSLDNPQTTLTSSIILRAMSTN